MIHEREHNPINGALIPFKAQLIRMEAAKKWGVDLSRLMVSERRQLTLFASMVMGTMKPPEKWREIDIMQKYHPCVDQWEMFFEGWLKVANNEKRFELHNIGIDIINFSNPYGRLLSELIGLTYGPEARDDVSCFLWENASMAYEYEDGTIKDLRKPADFALYFKELYDNKTFTEVYESGNRFFDN
jgi:hypothetical protein